MNILLCADSDLLDCMKVLLNSLAMNLKSPDIYICRSVLMDKEIEELEDLFVARGLRLHFYVIPEDIISRIRRLHRQYVSTKSSYMAWLRLAALFFIDVEKVLWLDADIVVDGDLQPLYDTDISEYYFAAVPDAETFDLGYEKMRLGIPLHYQYVNAGVRLMNLANMRKAFSLESLLSYMESEARWHYMQDQDFLNKHFWKKIFYLADKWNAMSSEFGQEIAPRSKEKAVIYHYAGSIKPWDEFSVDGYVWDMDVYERYSRGIASPQFYETVRKNVLLYREVEGKRLSKDRRYIIRSPGYTACLEYYLLRVRSKEGRIDALLKTAGYRTIIVYGIGRMGKFFVDEMLASASDVRIVCILDKAYPWDDYKGIPVKKLAEAVSYTTDALVITPIKHAYGNILEEIKNYFEDIPMFGILQLIYGKN